MAKQGIQDVRPRSLLLGTSRTVRGISSSVDDLILQGSKFRGNVTNAITSATLTRTIEGASTVTLAIDDSRGKLRNSHLLQNRFDIQLVEPDHKEGLDEGLWFRFVAASKQGDSLTLTFEDREVARLRKETGPKKAYRDQVTRAEFVLMLLREVKHPRIPAWIPELHVEQPIEKAQGAGKVDRNLTEQQTTKGLAKGANLTVKGIKATSGQIKIGEAALRVAASLEAPADAAAALMAALIVESLVGAISHNYLQVIPSTAAQAHINPNNIEESARAFLMGYGAGSHGAIYYSKNTKDDVAEIAQDVQNSGAGLATHGHANYGPWVNEAQKWVAAWKGGIGGGTLTTTRTVEKRYAFERKKNETSWDAIQRLAQEVKWRAFVSNGIFYYADEKEFLDAKTMMRVTEDAPGIDEIDWDWDMGKKVQEVTVTGRARQWAAPPGTVADVQDEGPASGLYIVESIDSNLFDADVTVTLKRPTKPLPEPAPETKQVTHTKHFGSGEPGSGNDLVRWAHKYVGTQEGSKLQQHWAHELGYSPGVPWCGIFVGAGIRATTNLRLPSNPAYSGAWLSWSDGNRVSLSKRQPGDLMVFDWGDGGITDHIGIYIGKGKMISGNYGDQVSLSDDRSGNCVGVVRPKGF